MLLEFDMNSIRFRMESLNHVRESLTRSYTKLSKIFFTPFMISLHEKIKSILAHHERLEHNISDPTSVQKKEFVEWSRELSQMDPLVVAAKSFLSLEEQLAQVKELLKDSDLKSLAQDEVLHLEEAIKKADWEVRCLLLPKDIHASRNAIVEIRPGAGGDEASLFGADLLRMYSRYAEWKGWKVELLNFQGTDQGGVREASLDISGKDVFGQLKWEAGVHRVQRVPTTEANGRLHTSTATVAVLPEAEEVDVVMEEKDLRIDVFRSSGPGGQSVNTTDSAVRITHIPTGLVVQQQDEKSQHKNKAKALKILRARLYDLKRLEQEALRANSRRDQVGHGDRSERIRTYNFPQGRVTDHRIKLTLHKIHDILEGAGLQELIDALRTQEVIDQMSQSYEDKEINFL